VTAPEGGLAISPRAWCSATFEVSNLGKREIFVGRATQEDGQQLISAPIWYE
jgi:hypothetical protein